MRAVSDLHLYDHLGIGLDVMGDAEGSSVACVLTGDGELDRLGGVDPREGEHGDSREGQLGSKLLPCHCCKRGIEVVVGVLFAPWCRVLESGVDSRRGGSEVKGKERRGEGCQPKESQVR